MGIVDYDRVEESNLQRQVIHSVATLNQLKVESARAFIANINPHVRVETFPLCLDSGNVLDIVKDFDVIVDGTDNVATRYLLNDACVLSKKPLVSGGALGTDGQVTVYNHNGGISCILVVSI